VSAGVGALFGAGETCAAPEGPLFLPDLLGLEVIDEVLHVQCISAFSGFVAGGFLGSLSLISSKFIEMPGALDGVAKRKTPSVVGRRCS